MRKYIALLLALVMCLSLCACGVENIPKEPTVSAPEQTETAQPEPVETTHHVGDTVETDLYQIELKNAQLAKYILVCNGEKADKATFTVAEEFFTPSETPFLDENGYVVEGIHGFSPSKSSEQIYLYYCAEFKYLGKEEHTMVNYDFAPVVTYGEYTFDTDYFTFYRTISDSETSSWSNFNSDFDAIDTVQALGLEIGYFNGKIKPLSNKVYEIRGIIPVPQAIADDADAELTLCLAGVDFVVE